MMVGVKRLPGCEGSKEGKVPPNVTRHARARQMAKHIHDRRSGEDLGYREPVNPECSDRASDQDDRQEC